MVFNPESKMRGVLEVRCTCRGEFIVGEINNISISVP